MASFLAFYGARADYKKVRPSYHAFSFVCGLDPKSLRHLSQQTQISIFLGQTDTCQEKEALLALKMEVTELLCIFAPETKKGGGRKRPTSRLRERESAK